ncbi:MAG TPA: hypothetical protein VM051_08045 [Usitatibacter sp.]|nr:hypothetical protein [Usitatibacter sp.]
MQRLSRWLASAALAFAPLASGQDAAAWLESQGLQSVTTKSFNEFDAVVAQPKGGGEQRAIIFSKGKPGWQSNPKETDPGSKWTIHSIGRDLDGNGQPDAHFSSHTGGANCCVTHHIYQLKPVKRLAVYSAGSMGGSDFIDVPGRKSPVMVSADDSSANAFAPYANSYFPLLILEVGQKGRMQFAQDMMQTRLPGMPPPVCTQPLAASNPWLKERCAEYTSSRRLARTKEIQTRLATIKASRHADKVRWEDYFENGVLASVSAEVNRYAYTGHGAAAMNWLETIWPGNDAVKAKFIATLRQTQAKSVFAEDLKSIASSYQ